MNQALRQVARISQVRLRETYQRHERLIPAFSFICGVGWDALFLGRMDQLANIIQLGVYLFIILIFLAIEFCDQHHPLIPPAFLNKVWKYREEVVHFLYGSLLSAFAIFYFKSSSLIGAAVLFILICTLLVANEFSIFRRLGLMMRTVVFALCATSYVLCLMPIAYKSFDARSFVASILASAGLLGIFSLMLWQLRANRHLLFKRIVVPYLSVLATISALYFLHLIPPVPLTLTHIGIYHHVERQKTSYRVGYLRDTWTFWRQGEEIFWASPGDKIYCFFSVFSPIGFKDKVLVQWLYRDPERGWLTQDTVPVEISGGRRQGYRGFVFKSSYQPGEWQVRIETSDAREIGRTYVQIAPKLNANPLPLTYQDL